MDEDRNPSPSIQQPPTYPDISPDKPRTKLSQHENRFTMAKGLAAGGILVTGLVSALFLVMQDQDIRQKAAPLSTEIPVASELPPAPPGATLETISPPEEVYSATYRSGLSLAELYRYYQDVLNAQNWQLTATMDEDSATATITASKAAQTATVTLNQLDDTTTLVTINQK